jgi:uncharacterized protein
MGGCMFRELRRIKQSLSIEEINTVMARCTNGVLACLGDDGYPYAVPLNYVYFNNKIYFHSAKAGHKIDAIAENSKVSFCIIDKDTISSEKYTSYFRSVIAFGKARIVEGEEGLDAFYALVEKYSGDQPESSKRKEVAECSHAYIISIDIDHISGKQAKELM